MDDLTQFKTLARSSEKSHSSDFARQKMNRTSSTYTYCDDERALLL